MRIYLRFSWTSLLVQNVLPFETWPLFGNKTQVQSLNGYFLVVICPPYSDCICFLFCNNEIVQNHTLQETTAYLLKIIFWNILLTFMNIMVQTKSVKVILQMSLKQKHKIQHQRDDFGNSGIHLYHLYCFIIFKAVLLSRHWLPILISKIKTVV